MENDIHKIVGKTIISVKDDYDNDKYIIYFKDGSKIEITGDYFGDTQPGASFYENKSK